MYMNSFLISKRRHHDPTNVKEKVKLEMIYCKNDTFGGFCLLFQLKCLTLKPYSGQMWEK